MEKETVIAQGAEAILIRKKNSIIKFRVSKGYRHPDLDKRIRVRRTRREFKILAKASKFINVPSVISVDESKTKIVMSFIPGNVLSDYLDSLSFVEGSKVCFDIGSEVGLLHNLDLVHGDLTTSNMILYNDKITLIDFGLGFHSSRFEDKAVDLRVLHQALKSKHFKYCKDYFKQVLSGYKITSKQPKKIFDQLKIVESRGRYKGKKRKLKSQ